MGWKRPNELSEVGDNQKSLICFFVVFVVSGFFACVLFAKKYRVELHVCKCVCVCFGGVPHVVFIGGRAEGSCKYCEKTGMRNNAWGSKGMEGRRGAPCDWFADLFSLFLQEYT